jgi:predicted lipopolysaccharide heptosyltransferase III
MRIAKHFDKPSHVNRILIIQLGDIGDVVWSLPAIRAVREAYPGATVTVLVRKGNGSLLTAEASASPVLEVPAGENGLWGKIRSSLRLTGTLRRERFDVVIDLRGDERGAYTAFLTGAPFRIALHYPTMPWPRNALFTHLVSQDGDPMPVGAAYPYLFILRAFGIETENATPRLDLSAEVTERAKEILTAAGVPMTANAETDAASGKSIRWVTVNPFSRWSYKEWNLEKWTQVIDWLEKDFGLSTVIVGAPSERDRSESLIGACSAKVFNLAGKSTLADLAGILKFSRLHIGVDSAAPHIAAAVGTPTVTIYGPSDWRYWAPRGENHRVVSSDWECAPCFQKGCDGSGQSRCLENTEVSAVQDVIRKALLPSE